MKPHLERSHLIRLALLALACALIVATRAPAQIQSRQLACPGPVPAGWVKVDAVATTSDCGGRDAWVLELYTNKIPGSGMVICADQPTPPGWETSSWPDDRSPQDNLRDLERHARDFEQRSGFTYTVIVADFAEPGRGADTFEIWVSSGYHASGTLAGGNIQLHG